MYVHSCSVSYIHILREKCKLSSFNSDEFSYDFYFIFNSCSYDDLFRSYFNGIQSL